MSLPKLSELREIYAEEVIARKVFHKDDIAWGKKEYVEALRELHLPVEGLPYIELNPMVCLQSTKLSEEEMDYAWESDRWVAQRKLNGVRIEIHFVENVGVFAHTRTVSVKNFRFVEVSKNLLLHDFIPDFSATIDCEATLDKPIDTIVSKSRGTVTKSSLHSVTALLHMDPVEARRIQIEQDAPIILNAFDCIFHDKPYELLGDRIEDLAGFERHILDTGLTKYFQFPKWVYEKKWDFFRQVVRDGGEGIILKYLSSSYNTTGGRPRNGWMKVKKALEFDAFVSGFRRGNPGTAWENMVGVLEFSIWLESGEQHVIGYCSGFDMELRERITSYNAEMDKVHMDEDLLGDVAEITGQDVSSRELRLSHAKISRWRNTRDDADFKHHRQCITSMEELKRSAEWVGK